MYLMLILITVVKNICPEWLCHGSECFIAMKKVRTLTFSWEKNEADISLCDLLGKKNFI